MMVFTLLSRQLISTMLLLCTFLSGIDTAFARQKLTISARGQRLRTVYLSMKVENLWIAEHHVNWETGQPDLPGSTHGNKTHCSAFVAATCKKLGIYILRPPEHGQLLLANAQANWLNSPVAKALGWILLADNEQLYEQAQRLANDGNVVVAIYKNDDEKKPGHTALVIPDERSFTRLAAEGPEVIMAGTHNHNNIPLKNGFHNHIAEWPEHEIKFFVYRGGLEI